MKPREDHEKHRWAKADGSRLVLTVRGRLLECNGQTPALGYVQVRSGCGHGDALVYAQLHGYRRMGSLGVAGVQADDPGPIKVVREVKGRRAPKGDSIQPQHLTPEQHAYRAERVRAEAARIQPELRELGLLRDEGPDPPDPSQFWRDKFTEWEGSEEGEIVAKPSRHTHRAAGLTRTADLRGNKETNKRTDVKTDNTLKDRHREQQNDEAPNACAAGRGALASSLHRLQIAERLRDLLRGLGEEATVVEIKRAALADGVLPPVSVNQINHARAKVWPGRSYRERPAVGVGTGAGEIRLQAAAPAAPPAPAPVALAGASLAPVVAAIRSVRQLAGQVGGLAALRDLVEAMMEVD